MLLYHNNGDGTFTDVIANAPASPNAKGSYGLTAVAADFDNDGWPDIYVACDSTPSLLFRNNHDGTFTEEGLETRRGAERRRHGAGRHGRWASAISTCDGNLDIFKTHFADDTPALYRNDGKGNFTDVTTARGPGRGDALHQLGRGHRGSG